MRVQNLHRAFSYLLAVTLAIPPQAFAETPVVRVSSAKTSSDRGARKRLIQNMKPWWVTPGGSANSSFNGGGAGNGDGDGQLGGSSNGSGANGKGGAGGAGGGGFGGGLGNGGAGAGGNPSQAKEKTEFDDSASKGGGSGRPPSGGNGPNAGMQQAVAFDKFYAMCLFMDGKAVSPAEGNATVKGMIDNMAQACKVNLVVFPITVDPGSYSHDNGASDQNNALQKSSCNIVEAIPGVTNASTSFCVGADGMADLMCGNKPKNPPYDEDPRDRRVKLKMDVSGCAQVNSKDGSQGYKDLIARLERLKLSPDPLNTGDPDFPTKKAAEDRLQEITDHGAPTGGGRDEIAPSIEDTGACDATTVAHEAIGHSMMGMPNGDGHGNGIGPKKVGAMTNGWTPEGCAVIRNNAMENDGKWKWEPNRQTYYVPPKDESNWWKMDGKKYFTKPNPAPLGGPVRPPITGGGGATVVMDDNAPKSKGDPGSGKPGKSQIASTTPDFVDPRHRLRPAPVGAPATGGVRKGTPVAGTPDDPQFAEKPKFVPPNNKAIPTKSVGFDDDVAKNSSNGGSSMKGGIGKMKVDAPPGDSAFRASAGGGGNGGQGTFFDDGAAKGEGSAAAPGGPGGGPGRGGGGFAFDDEASKSAPGTGGTVGMTGSAERGPASVEPTTFGMGRAQSGSGSGFSGSSEFFGGVGRDSGASDEEDEEQLRQKRRRMNMKDRLRGIDGEVTRRGRGAGRTPRSIPSSDTGGPE